MAKTGVSVYPCYCSTWVRMKERGVPGAGVKRTTDGWLDKHGEGFLEFWGISPWTVLFFSFHAVHHFDLFPAHSGWVLRFCGGGWEGRGIHAGLWAGRKGNGVHSVLCVFLFTFFFFSFSPSAFMQGCLLVFWDECCEGGYGVCLHLGALSPTVLFLANCGGGDHRIPKKREGRRRW